MSDTVRWTSGQATRQEPKAVDGANLADILERVLDKGIVIAGDIQVNLLDIELLTIKIRLVVASVDRAKEMGIDWWERDPTLSAGRQELEDENDELRSRIAALEAAMARAPALAEPGDADKVDPPADDALDEDPPDEDPDDLAEAEIEDEELGEGEDEDGFGDEPVADEDDAEPEPRAAPVTAESPGADRPRRRSDDGAPRRRGAAASGRAKAPAERPPSRRRKSREG
ncbi:gas vesicle protein GvpA/GvpJ/GvpM family [Pseudonocardia sediminis]|uniref:Gas vesicle protein GvpA/GvpJ/GvpM family n=1 Tax=Pseudonocardia sediminis TaxID=1397368 RepID=A0A4Q7V2S2_PSEST|nr:gas vesicle protein GvpA/GvpJ/GvpM family [Pseudonocardia sediminis]